MWLFLGREPEYNHVVSLDITFEFFGGVAKILVGEEVAEGKFLLAPLDFAIHESVLAIILSPIVGEMTFLLGHIDESKSPFVVVERFYPDVEAVKIHKTESLDAEFVLAGVPLLPKSVP